MAARGDGRWPATRGSLTPVTHPVGQHATQTCSENSPAGVFPFRAAARGPADAQLASSEDLQLLLCSPPRVSGPPAFSAKRGKANVRGGCRLGDLSGEAAQAVQERRVWARKGPRPFPRHWTSEPACWAVNGQEGKSRCGDEVDQ